MREFRKRLGLSTSMAVGALFAVPASPAHGVYTGLTIEHHTSITINSTAYSVWRLYADFTNANDRLVFGFGGSPPQYAPILVETRNANDTGPGNPFFVVLGIVTAPTLAQISANAAAQWASFVTIGTPIADLTPEGDRTQVTPGFLPIGGTVWTHTNQGWFVPPTIPDNGGLPPLQSLAGWTGDGDPLLRVMLAQFTVRAGENVRGSLNLSWFPPHGTGGGNTEVHESFQTFNSFVIPSPSAVIVLAVAALARTARRRHR